MGFNRTFMELKLVTKEVSIARIVRFNRTFMELKHTLNIATVAPADRFNRTFMELKHMNLLFMLTDAQV